MNNLAYCSQDKETVGFTGEVSLDDDGRFQGDPAASGKLNARKDLLKKCGAFAVTKGGLAGFEMKVPRFLRITPRDESAEIVVVTLPRSKYGARYPVIKIRRGIWTSPPEHRAPA